MNKTIQFTIKSLALVTSLTVIWGSLMKPDSQASSLPGFDKLVHFGAYAAQSFLYHWGFRLCPVKIIGFLFILGLSIELIQWPLTYRSFSLADLLANLSGILYGMLFLRGLLGFRNTSASN